MPTEKGKIKVDLLVRGKSVSTCYGHCGVMATYKVMCVVRFSFVRSASTSVRI